MQLSSRLASNKELPAVLACMLIRDTHWALSAQLSSLACSAESVAAFAASCSASKCVLSISRRSSSFDAACCDIMSSKIRASAAQRQRAKSRLIRSVVNLVARHMRWDAAPSAQHLPPTLAPASSMLRAPHMRRRALQCSSRIEAASRPSVLSAARSSTLIESAAAPTLLKLCCCTGR